METIKSSEEIEFLFKNGRRYNSLYITLIVYESARQHDQRGRVAFIAGKKLGNAVWRNAAKRRMRAIYQEIRPSSSHLDIIFLAKSGILKASYSKVLKTCEIALHKAVVGE
ncbi:MAG: ribonuclease P protein component [Eggerthellaceae bacterium]